jgi:hypothetical protein
VKIINAVGSVVYQQRNVSNAITIDLSAQAKGLYFILLKEKDGWRKTKLLLQ